MLWCWPKVQVVMECTWSDGRPRPSSEDRVSASVSARVHCFTAGRSRVPGVQVSLGTNAEVAFCRSDHQAVVRHMSETGSRNGTAVREREFHLRTHLPRLRRDSTGRETHSDHA